MLSQFPSGGIFFFGFKKEDYQFKFDTSFFVPCDKNLEENQIDTMVVQKQFSFEDKTMMMEKIHLKYLKRGCTASLNFSTKIFPIYSDVGDIAKNILSRDIRAHHPSVYISRIICRRKPLDVPRCSDKEYKKGRDEHHIQLHYKTTVTSFPCIRDPLFNQGRGGQCCSS